MKDFLDGVYSKANTGVLIEEEKEELLKREQYQKAKTDVARIEDSNQWSEPSKSITELRVTGYSQKKEEHHIG